MRNNILAALYCDCCLLNISSSDFLFAQGWWESPQEHFNRNTPGTTIKHSFDLGYFNQCQASTSLQSSPAPSCSWSPLCWSGCTPQTAQGSWAKGICCWPWRLLQQMSLATWKYCCIHKSLHSKPEGRKHDCLQLLHHHILNILLQRAHFI